MAEPQSVSQTIRIRMVEAFGEPHNTLDHDDHWMFRASPSSLPINLLLNGTREDAAIWLFDLHYLEAGVYSRMIRHEDEIAPTIQLIRDRITHARRLAMK